MVGLWLFRLTEGLCVPVIRSEGASCSQLAVKWFRKQIMTVAIYIERGLQSKQAKFLIIVEFW